MYRSAAGLMSATYRQGVIANNLANVETVGFKRDLGIVQQRKTAAQELPMRGRFGDPLFDKIGGGQLVSPTATDHGQGTLDTTGRAYDAAILGKGFFAVEKDGKQFLTRNGNFMLNDKGQLILADGSNARVLSRELAPIQLDPLATTSINSNGTISQYGVPVTQLAIKDADPTTLQKIGQQLMQFKDESTSLKQVKDAEDVAVQGEALERSNVDPAKELTQMLLAERELDANANMLRYQDQTLGRCVNDVGKIS